MHAEGIRKKRIVSYFTAPTLFNQHHTQKTLCLFFMGHTPFSQSAAWLFSFLSLNLCSVSIFLHPHTWSQYPVEAYIFMMLLSGQTLLGLFFWVWPLGCKTVVLSEGFIDTSVLTQLIIRLHAAHNSIKRGFYYQCSQKGSLTLEFISLLGPVISLFTA